MKTLFVLFAALMAVPAFADGFVCRTYTGDLNIKVYNHTDPHAGTRNGAILVLSDPTISYGRKTIATFTDVKSTLHNSGAHYTAQVDLRVSESSRKGELILGTKLGYIDQIEVYVPFSYSKPTPAGEHFEGEISILKRDGTEITQDIECLRYLKN